MGVTLAKMAKNEATISVAAGEDTINVVYYPALVTQKIINELDGGFEGFNQALASIIKSWDIYEDPEETQMFPLDPDRFDELGMEYLIDIARAIVKHIRPEARAARANPAK